MRRHPTEQEIARRAREIYEQRGHGEPDAEKDWLRAKAELEAVEAEAESEDAPAGFEESSRDKPHS